MRMVKDSFDDETDVLFLFDVGFTAEKIAQQKNMALEQVEAIISQRVRSVRKKKQKNVIQDVANQNPW